MAAEAGDNQDDQPTAGGGGDVDGDDNKAEVQANVT